MRALGSDNIDKTIHGVSVSQNAFKRAIAEALEGFEGGGSAADVLPALGAEWDTPAGRKVVSNTILNMWKAKALKRVDGQRGVYVVSGGFHRKGVGASDQIEQSILDSIRVRGGFATFAEIMDDHGLRPAGEDFTEARRRAIRKRWDAETEADNMSGAYDVRNTTAYAQVKKVLAESPIIRQDLLRIGLYNLPQDELNAMTLRGLFGGYMVMATVEEFGGNVKKQFAARDEFFAQVGSAFNAARTMKRINRDDFVKRPKVMRAFYDLMMRPAVSREINDWYAGETQVRVDEMVARGASKQEIADFREDRRDSREGRQLLKDLLERFEEAEPGWGVNIHCNAPVSFYEVLAAELEIDPVMASRGVVLLDLRGEKLRPRRNTPDTQRMIEIELQRERIIAERDRSKLRT